MKQTMLKNKQKELKGLTEEIKKYDNAEEFAKDNLLLAWIRRQLTYANKKNLVDVSKNDLEFFSEELDEEIKRRGAENVGTEIRNVANFYGINIPDIQTRYFELIRLYNQTTRQDNQR